MRKVTITLDIEDNGATSITFDNGKESETHDLTLGQYLTADICNGIEVTITLPEDQNAIPPNTTIN